MKYQLYPLTIYKKEIYLSISSIIYRLFKNTHNNNRRCFSLSYKRHATNGHHKPSHHSHSRSNKSKTPESATLAKPLKRCSRTPDSKLSSRSRSKQGETAAARSSNPPPHPPSYYDKNARVYHITP